MAESGGCCRCCCRFIFTVGLTALFMWLSLRTSNPTCSIEAFYVPALNKSANSSSNTSIYFDLRLKNGNKDKGIYYDALNLTFYYGPTPNLSVANASFAPFRQGNNKKTDRRMTVDARGVPWKAVPRNGSAVFRVDLETKVRFRILVFKTKRHGIKVGAPVEVNDQGTKVNRKGIKLKSGAPDDGCHPALLGFLGILFSLAFA
ncbi:protein NDR1-like [Malania oleifera]|uniref:protein NDR1-like n=1 Tax=Malania oleifera TaxID=397392 RepID=UPI0025ADE368|nr:protein NDR1-like [Malania oleifera]